MPASVQKLLRTTMEETKHFADYTLVLALNYGARTEVVDAARAYATAVAAGKEKLNDSSWDTFGRYLSEEVVDRLLETPEGLQLGGEKREVTILLADLRGFTAMADRYTPEQVVRVLNNYLGTMADLIVATRAPSTSSSATPSWPSSALPSGARTTPRAPAPAPRPCRSR